MNFRVYELSEWSVQVWKNERRLYKAEEEGWGWGFHSAGVFLRKPSWYLHRFDENHGQLRTVKPTSTTWVRVRTRHLLSNQIWEQNHFAAVGGGGGFWIIHKGKRLNAPITFPEKSFWQKVIPFYKIHHF